MCVLSRVCVWGAEGKRRLVARISPRPVSVWRWKLNRTQPCRTNGQVGPWAGSRRSHPTRGAVYHIGVDVTQTRNSEKMGIRGEPVIRDHFNGLISIACLMRKNTSGFCGQEPSLIILQRNTTPTELEMRTLSLTALYVEQESGTMGDRKRCMLFSNQSNQLWSASMSGGFMFQKNSRHNMWWFDCFLHIPVANRRQVPLRYLKHSCCSFHTHTGTGSVQPILHWRSKLSVQSFSSFLWMRIHNKLQRPWCKVASACCAR